MSKTTIRRATLADADTLAAFNSALAEETENRHLDPAVIGVGVRRVLSEPALGVYFVAECDRRVVGQLMVTGEFSDWRNGTFWWIQSVYVHPDYRGRVVYCAPQRTSANARPRRPAHPFAACPCSSATRPPHSVEPAWRSRSRLAFPPSRRVLSGSAGLSLPNCWHRNSTPGRNFL